MKIQYKFFIELLITTISYGQDYDMDMLKGAYNPSVSKKTGLIRLENNYDPDEVPANVYGKMKIYLLPKYMTKIQLTENHEINLTNISIKH